MTLEEKKPFLYMDLQYFAEEGPDDVEDDFSDDDEPVEEVEDEDIDIEDIDLSSLLEETEDEEEGDDEPQGEPPADPQDSPFTPEQQELVNRILQDRLARDRASRAPEMEKLMRLQRRAGLDLDGILEHVTKNKIEDIAMEYGVDEDEARRILEEREELEFRREQERTWQEQQTANQRQAAYFQEKQQYLNHPMVRKYEREIDQFAQGGMAIDFVPAMNYVLGQKVLNGEVTNTIRNSAEQRTLRNVQQRGKATPMGGSVGGPQAVSLSNQEKRIAEMLGISPKEYAREKASLSKRK